MVWGLSLPAFLYQTANWPEKNKPWQCRKTTGIANLPTNKSSKLDLDFNTHKTKLYSSLCQFLHCATVDITHVYYVFYP